MSTCALRLPESLHAHAKLLAEQDSVLFSIAQNKSLVDNRVGVTEFYENERK